MSKVKGWVHEYDVDKCKLSDNHIYVHEIPKDAVITEALVKLNPMNYSDTGEVKIAVDAALIGRKVKVIIYCEEEV